MLIIGVGNPHGGDDAAGLMVARGLAKRGIRTIQHAGPPLDLMDMWEGEDRVIVIDTASSGSAPGSMHTWDGTIADLSPNVFRSSTHAFGLADTIRLARTLDRLPKKLTVYGIEAAHFVAGAPPSPEIVEAVERTIDKIASEFFKSTTPSS